MRVHVYACMRVRAIYSRFGHQRNVFTEHLLGNTQKCDLGKILQPMGNAAVTVTTGRHLAEVREETLKGMGV